MNNDCGSSTPVVSAGRHRFPNRRRRLQRKAQNEAAVAV